MNETRKKIIINEIHYWKKSRILPEQYCNFLLALYTEGEYEQEVSSPKRPTFRKQYIIMTAVIVSALIVNYFTEIVPLMQILLFLIFLVFFSGTLLL